MDRLACLVVGLGRMGHGIAQRLAQAQITVFGYDPYTSQTSSTLYTRVTSLNQVLDQIHVVWLMLPAGDSVTHTCKELAAYLKPDQIVVDGGNSHPDDAASHAAFIQKSGATFADCGTSGGVDGQEHGYCLMVGTDAATFEKLTPYLRAIAAPDGFCHTGPVGSGHFVKTIHNGIEYGLLQAYAEGIALLLQGPYTDLDIARICTTWQHGSVIRSWINHLCADIFTKNPDLAKIPGQIGENQTGQWAQSYAHNYNLAFETLDLALKTRAWSRETGGDTRTKIIALLRNRFGNHPLYTEKKS